MQKHFLLATGILAGTVIGAGIFSLPYIVSRVGLFGGVFYLCAFGFVYFAVHRMYAALVETRREGHKFVYFAQRYLPKWLRHIASFFIFGELVFVMVVYLILAPTFIQLFAGLGEGWALFLFWLVGSLFMLARLSWIGLAEAIGTISMMGIALVIFYFSGTRPLETPFFSGANLATWFIPFGPILFSLAGRPAISKVVEEHWKSKEKGKGFSLSKAIFWGTFIPITVYLIFIVSILKLNPNVSPQALDSLGFLSPYLVGLLGILGFLTLWTSYFMIGIEVKDIVKKDLKLSNIAGIMAAWGLPIFLYAVGFKNFIFVISFTGSIFLGLEGIFVVWMWRNAFPESSWRWVSWPLFLVFSTAVLHEVVLFF